MGRWENTPTGDRPRSGQGDELRGSGSGMRSRDEPVPVLREGSTREGVAEHGRAMRAYAVLRREFADVAGNGTMPDDHDFLALPRELRDEAKALCRRAVETFETGNQEAARSLAKDGFLDLAGKLPRTWHPPTERPSLELLDEIMGLRR